MEERIALGIHGLQPPRFKTQEEQLALCKASVMKYTEDLNRYLYLVELQVNELLIDNEYICGVEILPGNCETRSLEPTLETVGIFTCGKIQFQFISENTSAVLFSSLAKV